MIQWLRVVAVAEAISYLCLLAAVVAKRLFAQPAGVSLIGPIHGLLFVAYFVLVIFVREERGWSPRQTALVLVAAVVPLGGYLVERRLLAAEPGSAQASSRNVDWPNGQGKGAPDNGTTRGA